MQIIQLAKGVSNAARCCTRTRFTRMLSDAASQIGAVFCVTLPIVVLLLGLTWPATANALTVDEATDLWTDSTHALQGVNCSSCHQVDGTGDFVASPDQESCRRCHEFSTDTFLLGKHGIRTLEGQSPLTPEMALLSMQPDAHGTEMTCNTCHDVHAQDMHTASVDACLTCHSDDHSLNYLNSKHAGLLTGNENLPRPGAGEVTCATCHLPRQKVSGEVRVNHNNTYNLLPGDRMVADVCMNCHGFEFSYNAVFDDDLVTENFAHLPEHNHESLAMVRALRDRRNNRNR